MIRHGRKRLQAGQLCSELCCSHAAALDMLPNMPRKPAQHHLSRAEWRKMRFAYLGVLRSGVQGLEVGLLHVKLQVNLRNMHPNEADGANRNFTLQPPPPLLQLPPTSIPQPHTPPPFPQSSAPHSTPASLRCVPLCPLTQVVSI